MRCIISWFSKQDSWQEAPARHLQAASPLHWSWGSVRLRQFGSQVLQEMLLRARALVRLLLSSSPSFPFVSYSVRLRSHILPAYSKSGFVLWSWMARSCRGVRTTWAAAPARQSHIHSLWPMQGQCLALWSLHLPVAWADPHLKPYHTSSGWHGQRVFAPAVSGQETRTGAPGHL